MEVDDAAREGIDEVGRNERQEACQHDEADVMALQQGQRLVGIVQLSLCNDCCGHSQPFCPHQGVCVGLVADDQGAPDVGMFKMANEVLTVSSAAGDKDGDIHFAFTI